ncbi:hypothetical protein H9W95_10060 [Flavobacterium lindanitolerans]|nr:hypothetical protein [Flavobacterium lindanitolerans]
MSSASFSLAYHGANRGYQIDVPLAPALGVDDIEAAKSLLFIRILPAVSFQ